MNLFVTPAAAGTALQEVSVVSLEVSQVSTRALDTNQVQERLYQYDIGQGPRREIPLHLWEEAIL